MKTTKEKADELIEQHYRTLINNDIIFASRIDAIKCAILSVKHTLDTLNIKLSEISKNRQENEFSMWVLESLIEEQEQLLTELESRV